MARDRVISQEGAVLFWTPILIVGWAGALVLYPKQTLVALAVCAVGIGVFVWRETRRPDPEPPSWVNDSHLGHVHNVGKAESR